MKTVSDILKQGQEVHTIGPDSTVQAAIHLMTSERVTALPVMEKAHLIGIITETDYIRHITSKKVSAWSVKVEEIMSIGVITIGLDSSVDECLQLMSDKKIRHLPVISAGQIVGIVYIADLLTARNVA